jgi:hypothetical protein
MGTDEQYPDRSSECNSAVLQQERTTSKEAPINKKKKERRKFSRKNMIEGLIGKV